MSTRLEVPLDLNEKYQTSSASEKCPLEAGLQTDTGHPENQSQKCYGVSGFFGVTLCVGWRVGNAASAFMRKTQLLLFSNTVSIACIEKDLFC